MALAPQIRDSDILRPEKLVALGDVDDRFDSGAAKDIQIAERLYMPVSFQGVWRGMYSQFISIPPFWVAISKLNS
jgi:hypothetical protein